MTAFLRDLPCRLQLTDSILGSDALTFPSLLDITVDELSDYLGKGAFTSVELVTVRYV